MRNEEIVKLAKANKAAAFITLLEESGIQFVIIDMDNLCNPNDGYCNIDVAGCDAGESILFVDGKFDLF